jgi:hypothetical protein
MQPIFAHTPLISQEAVLPASQPNPEVGQDANDEVALSGRVSTQIQAALFREALLQRLVFDG